MTLKDFLFKKTIERKISGMTDEQKKAVLGLFEKNPEFLDTIVKNVQKEVESGRKTDEAVKYVMEKNQKQLMEIFKEGGLIK